MPDSPLYNVVIHDLDVRIECIEPGSDGYRIARKHLILRERDASKAHDKATKEGLPADGTWSFASMVNAKSFALLQLKTIEQSVEDNLDRIQAYHAPGATSGGELWE